MTNQERFDALMAEGAKTRTKQAREEHFKKMDAFFAEVGKEEAEKYYRQMMKFTIGLHQENDMLDKLEYAVDILSMGKVAKEYFGKSKAWMSQKLNGTTQYGKMNSFTPSEVDILKSALKDIAAKLIAVADSL